MRRTIHTTRKFRTQRRDRKRQHYTRERDLCMLRARLDKAPR